MSFYDEVHVRPFINAGGWMFTRYGGSIMPSEVVAAMAQASRNFVNLYDLQDRVGESIAAMTHNEAAFVSCGAASGITLAVAGCIAGTDAALADRLPDTQGLRNQVIMCRSHRGTEADPAVRAAGAKIVPIGPQDRNAGPLDFAAAFTDQTAAVLLVSFEAEPPPDVGKIVAAAHQRNIPVLIDGACTVPPKENLRRYTRDLGADAFITSGGKSIRGPQSTGLVLGRRAVIDGCKFHASPNLRIGRGMKVTKEGFAGIYTALKLFLAKDFAAESAREARQIHHIAAALKDIPGLKLTITGGSQLQIGVDPAATGTTAGAVAKTLLNSTPSILLRGRDNTITLRANLLQEGEEVIVGECLRRVIMVGGKV
jgi:L-seryl-tRNA(Ser) seleniumtransferase